MSERRDRQDDGDGRGPVHVLDEELARLPRPELDALWARSVQVAAQRRLVGGRARLVGGWARYEPAVFVALSVAQLLWAALRVFAFAR